MSDHLFNKYKLVKMRSVLIEQIDQIETNRIIELLSSEGFFIEKEMDLCTAEKSKNRLPNLLHMLERHIDLEDKKSSTRIFDIFLNCLKNCNRQDLVDLLKNVDVSSIAEGAGKIESENIISSVLQAADDVPLTEKILTQIVANIGKGWEAVAHCLDISQAEIDLVMEENPLDSKEQIFKLFLGWKNKNNGTTVKLLEALANSDCQVIWQNIQKIL